jgi:anthranilate phosphoribosyltransferase
MALEDHGGWPGVLQPIVDGHDISADAAAAVMRTILDGEATGAQIAAFIVGLRMKGESVDEMAGMVRAMLDAATPLQVMDGAIDIVGTGGSPSRRDGALNVSTMACFVARGAGATVCKHGNRAATSTSGAFDLLESLGVPMDLDPTAVARCVNEAGIGFAFARAFHPSFRHAAPVRGDIGIPTVFNVLGPLSNPGRVKRQVLGVADPTMAERMLRVLVATGSVHSMVVSGAGNLDELSTTGLSTVHHWHEGESRHYELAPEDVGLARVSVAELGGGDAATNAAIARRVLAGEPGPVRDIVVLNAAAGLVVADLATDLADGVALAQKAIDSGAAGDALDRLLAVSRG